MIAVVGCGDFDRNYVEQILSRVLTVNTEVVTGDVFVGEYCKKNSINCEVLDPLVPKEKISYFFRDVELITMADLVIVFWDGKSSEVKFVIDYARARGKDVRVFRG